MFTFSSPKEAKFLTPWACIIHHEETNLSLSRRIVYDLYCAMCCQEVCRVEAYRQVSLGPSAILFYDDACALSGEQVHVA
jgi:hypothetical protein